MTVSSATNEATFPGNGVAQVFPLPFRFFNNTEIIAQLINETTGAAEPLDLNDDYTLSGAGDPEVDGNATGVLTMLSPVATGFSLFVRREIPLTQPTDIVNQGRFFPEVHETVFDRLLMQIQQGIGSLGKALRVIPSEPNPSFLPRISERAFKLLSFDADGNPVASAPVFDSSTELRQDLLNTSDPAKNSALVGFLQAGAGAVGRTSQSKMRDIIDVRDYGALFNGTDETAKLQAAINQAVARGVRYINVDGTLYAPGSLTNRSNVIFVGSGELVGVYRRNVYPLRSHPLTINDVSPKRHLPQFTASASPVVVLAGDSIATLGANAIGSQASLALQLQKKLSADNPGKSITFYNRSIGGQTYTTFNSLPSSVNQSVYPWYDDLMKPWIDYVEDLQPDVVFLSFGMNDNSSFSRANFMSVVDKLNAFAKKPDIVFITNLVPTLEPGTGFEDFGGFLGQEGRDLPAGFVRNYARRYDYGLIDMNRWQNIARDGRDILATDLKHVQDSTALPTGAFTASAQVRDFRIQAQVIGDAAFIDDIFDGPDTLAVRLGRATTDSVLITRQTGNFRFQFFAANGLAYETVDTTIPVPTSSFTMLFEKFDNTFRFQLQGGAGGELVYTGLLSSGGVFFPQTGYFTGGAFSTGPYSAAAYSEGVESRYLPELTNTEMWGPGSSVAETKLPWGGNGVNHPATLGVMLVVVPAIWASDFRCDNPIGYTTRSGNPAAVAYMGADFDTVDSSHVSIGNRGTGQTRFLSVGAEKLVLTTGALNPVTSLGMNLGSSTNLYLRAYMSRINVTALPTFADNAAATAGGVPVGDFYRTAAGAVMVRF